eukprot:5343401-Pyramimonas_sp.AAC.1
MSLSSPTRHLGGSSLAAPCPIICAQPSGLRAWERWLRRYKNCGERYLRMLDRLRVCQLHVKPCSPNRNTQESGKKWIVFVDLYRSTLQTNREWFHDC